MARVIAGTTANAITLDESGDVYVTGSITETNRGSDTGLIKYKTDGTQRWVTTVDGRRNGRHQAAALSQNNAGQVYVAANSPGANGWAQYALAKYETNGSLLWSARYGNIGLADAQVAAMALDSSGNPVLTGNAGTIKYDAAGAPIWTNGYRGRAVAVDPQGGTYLAGFFDSTVLTTAKLDEKGDVLWTRTYNAEPAQALTLDRENNVIVAGLVKQVCDRLGCYYHFLAVKYDTAGNFQWAVPYGDYLRAPSVKGVSADSQGNIVIAGHASRFFGWQSMTAKLDSTGQILYFVSSQYCCTPQPVRAFALDADGNAYLAGERIVKLNTNGTKVWEWQYSGPGSGVHQPYAIAVDAQSNLYVTGSSPGGANGTNITTMMLDRDGNRMWVMEHDGPSHRDDESRAILVDPLGSVYMGGYDAIHQDGSDCLLIKYSYLQNVRPLADGSQLIRFFGTHGRQYRFYATPNITGNWQHIGSRVAETDGIVSYLDLDASNFSQRFYKLIE